MLNTKTLWTLCSFGLPLLLTPAAASQRPTSVPETTVLEIQQKIADGDLHGAAEELSATMQRFPSNGGLENLLGVVEVQQGQTQQAKQQFQRAIEHSPTLASAYLNLGRLLLMTANTEASRHEALQMYRRLAKVDPANAEAHYQIANLLLADQEYTSSLGEAMKLPAQDRKRANVETLLCADHFGLHQVSAGEQTCSELAANPELVEQDAMTALPALRQTHRADLIDALFTAASQHQTLSATGVRILGLAQEAEGHLDQARATLERAYSMDNNDAAVLTDLTRLALAKNDDQAALGYLAHARALRPQDASLAFEFGLICLQTNLLGEALKATREAVQLAPENPEYTLQLGAVTTIADDPSRALPTLQKYHTMRPADPKGDLALGAAYFQHNEYATALPWLQRAAQDPATAAAAHYYTGAILSQQGQRPEALAELRQAERLNPNQPDVHAQLGQLYVELGRYPEAEQQLDRALALNPDHYAANLALVRLYARTKDARREQQEKRVETLRGHKDEQYSQAMRVISVKPLTQPVDSP